MIIAKKRATKSRGGNGLINKRPAGQNRIR